MDNYRHSPLLAVVSLVLPCWNIKLLIFSILITPTSVDWTKYLEGYCFISTQDYLLAYPGLIYSSKSALDFKYELQVDRYQSISSHLALTWNSSNHLWLDRTSLLYMQTSKYIIGTNGDMKFFYTKKCNEL